MFKLNNLHILVASLVFLLPSLASAQKKILNDKVEVTKSYEHNISSATKRAIRPIKEDSVTMKIPTLDYSITYRPDRYPFTINQLATPNYKIAEEEQLYGGYLDLMGGLPAYSAATLSYTTKVNRNTISGVNLTHNGFWGKLPDANSVNRSALNTDNNLSLFLDYERDRFRSKVFLMQNYQVLDRYGFNLNSSDVANLGSMGQYFLRSTVRAEAGTPFHDPAFFNFNIYAQYNVMIDKYGYDESIYTIGALASKGLKGLKSRIEGKLEYVSIVPTRQFNLFDLYGETPSITSPPLNPDGAITTLEVFSPSTYLSLTPRYVFEHKGIDISLGALFNFSINASNINYKQNTATIIPKAKVSFGIGKGTVKTYFAMDGDYIINNYYTLSEMNPYIVEGLTAPNTTIRRYFAGLTGNIASNFSYDFNVGARSSRDLIMFVNTEGGNLFKATRGDYDNLEVNVEVGYTYRDKFAMQLDINYIDYDTTNSNNALNVIGIAPLNARMSMSCYPNDRLSFTLSADIQSARRFVSDTAMGEVTKDVDTATNLSLNAEYKYSERFGFKLNVTNILNQQLYQYNNYQGVRAGILGGLYIKFM